MIDSGIVLIKYWLEVGPDDQTRRLESRIDDDPRTIWKLSELDLQSLVRASCLVGLAGWSAGDDQQPG